MVLAPATSAPAFLDEIVPTLLQRYDAGCFCRSTGLRKLVSFDFRDYGIAPVALVDASLVIHHVLLRRFEPVMSWNGSNEREDRCTQCGTRFRTRYEQLSINMDHSVMTALDSLPRSDRGLYLVGFHRFRAFDHEIARIADFARAVTTDEFLEAVVRD